MRRYVGEGGAVGGEKTDTPIDGLIAEWAEESGEDEALWRVQLAADDGEILTEVRPRSARDMPEIRPRCARDLPEMCARDDLPETVEPAHFCV